MQSTKTTDLADNNGKVCWDNLMPGDYQVRETLKPGWAFDDPSDGTWTVDLSPGEKASRTFVNLQLGCLKITKQWIEGEMYFSGEIPQSIQILIEGPSFDDSIDYPYGGLVVTLEYPWTYETCYVLIPGSYTVSELNVDETKWAVTYDVGAGEVAQPTAVEVVGGEQAEVTIRNYFLYEDETFWAYGEEVAIPNNKVPGNRSNAWGWTNFIDDAGTYTWDLWAAAGQNILSNGFKVGTLTVIVTEENGVFCAKVTYNIEATYTLEEYHLWVGDTWLPMVRERRGRDTYTAAPGQFPYGDGETVCGLSSEGFWVAAHGVIRMASIR